MIGTEAKDYQFLQRRYGQEEDAIVCLTDAGVVCYANEPFCRRLGYDPETVFGRSAEEIIEFAPLEGLEPDQETESLGRSRITYVLDTRGPPYSGVRGELPPRGPWGRISRGSCAASSPSWNPALRHL